MLNVESFCQQFEHTYNMELDKGCLAPVEANAFAALFEQVVWYSPFADEVNRIPNYRGVEDIAKAVELVAQQLGEED